MSFEDSSPELRDRLLEHQDAVRRFLARNGRGLERYDRRSDVFQDFCVRALETEDRFEARTEEEFIGWMLQVARRHIADRHRHFRRLKRDQAAASGAGPATFAERRELLARAVQALDTLPERDRRLVAAMNEGQSVSEIAASLGISEAAAQRARLRAMDRFRRALEALSQ